MENNQDDGKQYYVVQFTPFEEINNYVCVPHSWIVVRISKEKMVAIAYPNNEDPFDTKHRVKRKEIYKKEWELYIAEIRFETDTYKDAEYWIASRKQQIHQLSEIAMKRLYSGSNIVNPPAVRSTVVPRILPWHENRQTRAPKRLNSINHNQYSSRIKEPPNKKCMIRGKIVLPAEYDPNNTEWTLKYRKMVPGLKELFPGSGIYVNSKKLMYAEGESGDCKALASLVLEEVFSETALVVCSTYHETQSPKNCWIERPPLDPPAYNALYNYVKWHGRLRGWSINDTGEIFKAMDSKIYEIRVKHNLLAEPYSP